MRWAVLLFLSALSLIPSPAAHVRATPDASADPAPLSHLHAAREVPTWLVRRDEHNGHDTVRDSHANESVPAQGHEHDRGHGFSGTPLTEINETLILLWHKPTPPSYGTHDFDDPDVTSKYPGLMGLHALFMSAAFFVALPVGIALRSVNHALHGVSVAAFYGLIVLGLSSSALYMKLTPNMYEDAKHIKHGYFVIGFALSLTAVDCIAFFVRAARFIVAVRRGDQQLSFKAIWYTVAIGRSEDEYRSVPSKCDAEYTGLVVEEPSEMEMDAHELKAVSVEDLQAADQLPSPVGASPATEVWPKDLRQMHAQRRHHNSEWRQSVASDGTLFNHEPAPGTSSPRGSIISNETLTAHDSASHWAHRLGKKTSLIRRVGRGVFSTLERVLVFLGYMQVLTGIVTYTGGCRDSYVNGCLAHLIKGGIFWCYGLVTFARFLGSFAEIGWAWNLTHPRHQGVVSVEFVESLVIFLYGITNTWMERFGVVPGTPYSTKEVQHISIAVMFWFAGLVGMGIESRRVRRWLAASAASALQSTDPLVPPELVREPPSYTASFNPFPALVIGVTGAAMAAHAQVYLFQVQIHSLWGKLLAAFAVLRCLTYFFLWLGPPRSILPSRPPTEALASFFLACGGLMFQFSTEELTLAAMRRGHADQMMFLNVVVAITCLAFCWTMGIVTFKGWLKSRLYRSTYNASA